MFSTCATDFAEKEELLEVVMLLSPVPPNKIQLFGPEMFMYTQSLNSNIEKHKLFF